MKLLFIILFSFFSFTTSIFAHPISDKINRPKIFIAETFGVSYALDCVSGFQILLGTRNNSISIIQLKGIMGYPLPCEVNPLTFNNNSTRPKMK